MIHFNRHNTRPIALAHGAGGAIDDNFADIAHVLRDEFHLFGHNYPGSGDTPADNAPLSIEEQADKLINSALELGYSTFPVFGYSLGTTVAVTAAYRRPDSRSRQHANRGLCRFDAVSEQRPPWRQRGCTVGAIVFVRHDLKKVGCVHP